MATGYKGGGTMSYKWKVTTKNKKDLVPGTGERQPMPQGTHGRVVYGGKGRAGRQEGTGPAS